MTAGRIPAVHRTHAPCLTQRELTMQMLQFTYMSEHLSLSLSLLLRQLRFNQLPASAGPRHQCIGIHVYIHVRRNVTPTPSPEFWVVTSVRGYLVSLERTRGNICVALKLRSSNHRKPQPQYQHQHPLLYRKLSTWHVRTQTSNGHPAAIPLSRIYDEEVYHPPQNRYTIIIDPKSKPQRHTTGKKRKKKTRTVIR